MKKRSSLRRQSRSLPCRALLLGALLAAAVILLLMALWTLLLLWEAVPLSTISPVNAVLKFLGAGLSAFFSAKACVRRPALFGGAAGVLFYLLSFASMSLFSGEWSFSPALLGDGAVTLAVGMATGAGLSLLRESGSQSQKRG